MRYYLYIVCLFILFSCKKENNTCFKGYGDNVIEIRTTEAFHTIENDAYITVYLVQDSMQYIELKGGDNVLPFFTTEVKDSVLFIKNNNKCNWLRSYSKKPELYIHTGNLLHTLKQLSSSNVYSYNTLTLPVLHFKLLGSNETYITCSGSVIDVNIDSNSDFILKGDATSFTGSLNKISLIDASEANIETIIITHHSELNCKFHTNNSITAYIYSEGNIEVSGNPAHYTSYGSGSGKLILK